MVLAEIMEMLESRYWNHVCRDSNLFLRASQKFSPKELGLQPHPVMQSSR